MNVGVSVLGEVRGGSFTDKWRKGCTILQGFSIVKLPIDLISPFRLIGIHKP